MDYPPPSSSSLTLSPQSPAANLNVFRPRRSDDWLEYREIIEQLYRTDQLKLRDVKRIMERDYKFYASYADLPFSSVSTLFILLYFSDTSEQRKTVQRPPRRLARPQKHQGQPGRGDGPQKAQTRRPRQADGLPGQWPGRRP